MASCISQAKFANCLTRFCVAPFTVYSQPKEDKPKDKDKDAESTESKENEDEEGGSSVLRALDGLTVRFPRGSVTAVLGHNGAGKSTAVGCITGGVLPTSGKIRVNGRDISEAMGWLRSVCGVCPQHDTL